MTTDQRHILQEPMTAREDMIATSCCPTTIPQSNHPPLLRLQSAHIPAASNNSSPPPLRIPQRTPPHLHPPEGLTREDYEELNKGKTAQIVRSESRDWVSRLPLRSHPALV